MLDSHDDGRNTGTLALTIDLAFFASALGDRAAISNMHEHNLTVGHLFRAAFEHMAASNAMCAQRLAPANDWSQVVFSGGLAQHIAALRESIMRQFRVPARVCAASEDTLQGLLALALVCSGEARTAAEATRDFSEEYRTEDEGSAS